MTEDHSNAITLGALGMLSGTVAWALIVLAGLSEAQRCRISRHPVTISMLCVSLLSACASHVAPVKDATVLKELGFLRLESTGREEVLVRLGTPARIYEDGRIVSYAVYKTADGRLSVTAASAALAPGELFGGERYTLILVFKSDGTLDRQGLVGRHE